MADACIKFNARLKCLNAVMVSVCHAVFGSSLFILCSSETFGRAWCCLIDDKNAELEVRIY